MSIEENNIQALLSIGANINQQEKQGNSALHLAVNRYIDDQDNYFIYKAIMKQLLRLGASRTLENNKNLSSYDLLKLFKFRIK